MQSQPYDSRERSTEQLRTKRYRFVRGTAEMEKRAFKGPANLHIAAVQRSQPQPVTEMPTLRVVTRLGCALQGACK
jgi:hypothetical protein